MGRLYRAIRGMYSGWQLAALAVFRAEVAIHSEAKHW
jgi:hypothetical protein